MTGGLIQLVANSTKNVFLTGNPQITFFKTLYKRYSNFSINIYEQNINGTPFFNNNINCLITKTGDLLKTIYFEIILPDLNIPTGSTWVGYTNNIGCSLIKQIRLKINDQIIDTINGEWIDIYNNIISNDIQKMVLEYNTEYSLRCSSSIPIEKRTIYLPIPFFFSKNSGSALPLIALNNSNINIDIELRPLNELVKTDNILNINNITVKENSDFIFKIWSEYIFLDDTERTIFSNKTHEYLIEQIQYNGGDTITKFEQKKNVYINFKYPIKELVWVITTDNKNLDTYLQNDINNITKYTTKYSNYQDTFDKLTIKLNSIQLIESKEPEYFRLIQSNLYHKNKRNKYIYSYSFALNPSEFQPSGTINFSDLNDVLFLFEFNNYQHNTKGSSTNGIIHIYGINYNILKITSGLGSLVYYIL